MASDPSRKASVAASDHAAAGAFHERIQADQPHAVDIADPVEPPGVGKQVEVAERRAHGLAAIMVSGNGKQRQVERRDQPAKQLIAFHASVVAEIAGHQQGVDGSDARQRPGDRRDGALQQRRRIENPRNAVRRNDEMGVGEVQDAGHGRSSCTI